MKQHIVKLIFIYDEEDFPEITDKDSAIKEAKKEIEETPLNVFHFDYDSYE